MTWLLVALGAVVAAPARYLLGRWLDGPVPWGTLVANLVGSALLGACAGWAFDAHALALVGTGFCGTFTTYSSLVVGAVERGPRRGTAYALGTVVASLLCCTAGFLLAR